MKILVDCPDNRITPDLLEKWAKIAKNSVNIKILCGSLDKKEDAALIAIVSVLSRSKLSLAEP